MCFFNGPKYDWPCEYCKEKFLDVRSVINHELYVCDKNPKFNYPKFNYKEKYLKNNQDILNKCQEPKYQENP